MRTLGALCIILGFALACAAQKLPSEIRGYKVFDPGIRITATMVPTIRTIGQSESLDQITAPGSAGFSLVLGEPRIAGMSLSGITIELPIRTARAEQDAKVDLLAFHDFTVDGIPITIEDYEHSFNVKKGKDIEFSSPARLLIKNASLARAALTRDLRYEKVWLVTGTVFVFGHFKRFGFSFKRVVPIRLEVTLPNPLLIAAQR